MISSSHITQKDLGLLLSLSLSHTPIFFTFLVLFGIVHIIGILFFFQPNTIFQPYKALDSDEVFITPVHH